MSLLPYAPAAGPAIVDGDTGAILTHGELRRNVAGWKARFGTTKRLVALLCRNDVATIEAYLGAFEGGHAVMLLDAGAGVDVAAPIISAYEPSLVVAPAGLTADLASRGLPVANVVEADAAELATTDFAAGHELFPGLAVLLATSGTTGSRKYVRLSGASVESNARSIASYLGLHAGERAVTSLPLHYSFGLSVLNSHLLAGATVVTTQRSVLEPAFWNVVRELACTSMAGVPYTYQILERIGFRSWDVPSLHVLQQAGGALDVRLAGLFAEHMRARGGRFYVMYGQTEATARIAYVPPDRMPEKLGSAGIPIPGGRLWIDRRAEHDEAGRGEGEVVYEGPNVMLGYATGASDLDKGDDLHGVLRTGDLGYLDDEGFLFLVGRSKRIAKVFGLRVNLDEVEARLSRDGPAAVVGGTDAVWGFCAFGTDATVAELARAVARDLHVHHHAVRVRRVDTIPTTSSGKTDYQVVQGWVELAEQASGPTTGM